MLNISLSSNAGRLDIQFDEGRFLHINLNGLIGKAGSVALEAEVSGKKEE